VEGDKLEFFHKVGAGSGRAATSKDTTTVGAEALGVERGMGSRSRRVKGGPPDRELRESPWRESFYDEHGGGAFWTAEASRRGGRRTSKGGSVGFGIVQQQTLTAGQEFGATAIGQESEETNADKAAGQNMQQETSQELLRGERHLLFLIAVGVIVPAEGNLVVLESQETLVGDGHPMGVASEIAQHMLGTTEGWLGSRHSSARRMAVEYSVMSRVR
jgi:hypothetical protein